MAKDARSNRFVGGPDDIRITPPKNQQKPKSKPKSKPKKK